MKKKYNIYLSYFFFNNLIDNLINVLKLIIFQSPQASRIGSLPGNEVSTFTSEELYISSIYISTTNTTRRRRERIERKIALLA